MVRHALALEDKSARRASILEAARGLFVSGDGSLPSSAEIASAAGLAKGTLYLYFRTKEEIFVALLMQDLQALLLVAEETFRTASGSIAQKVEAFLAAYLAYTRRHPELLRLDAIGHGVLEKNIDPDKLRQFKATLVEQMLATGAVMDAALDLAGGRGITLLMRTFALTRGLWQSSNPCDVPFPEHVSGYPFLYPEFYGELEQALGEYWRGALSAC